MRWLFALTLGLLVLGGLPDPGATQEPAGDSTDQTDDSTDQNREGEGDTGSEPAGDESDAGDESSEAGDQIEEPGESTGEESAVEVVEPPADELVILELAVPEFTMTRDMTGYYDPETERLRIPLLLFVEQTELPIDVDIEAGRAEGWVHDEDRTFELDLAEETVAIEGETRRLEPGDARRHYDDIYVDIDRLAEWFSFDYEFDFSLMKLEVDPDPPFPPQQRIIREQRRERIEGVAVLDEPRFDVVSNPYRLWSRPVHEFGVDVGFPTARQVDTDDHRRRTIPQTNRYQIRGAGDLLYMNAHWSIAGSERHPIRRTRLRFDRKDPDGELLGDAEATEIRAGDILSPIVPMISRSDRGRGVEVSSFPLNRPTAFDQTTISGPREPGWEVELYRNGELIDYREASDEDYYHFEDVPLLFGTNELRVVQYGPHGQEHEEVYRYEVGPDMISPGEDHYRVSVSQHNTETIPITSGRRTTDVDGHPRASVEYERGISERLAVAARANTLPLDEGEGRQRFFSTLGIRNAFSMAYTSLDLLVSNGLGLHGRVQSRIGELNVSAESAQFFGGFTSEQFPYDNYPLLNRTRLRLNGVIPAVEGIRLPFSVRLQNDYRSELGSQTRLSNRLSAHTGELSLIHDATLRRHPDNRLFANGMLTVRRREPRLTPRAAVHYTLDRGLRSYRLGLDWGLTSKLEFRGSIVHEVDTRHDLTIRNALHYRHDGFNLEGNLGFSHSGGVSVGIGVSWGVAHNPETRQWEPTSERLTSSGRIVPRVFMDNNQSGTFEEGTDEPVDGVEFAVNESGRRDAETNEEGIAVLSDIRPHEHTDIEVRRDTLHDPFLVPDPEGHSVVTRPGTRARIDFPLVMTGEIDGTVRMVTGGEARPAQSLTVQLVDDSGEVVDETTTAFDGFYLFDFIPPGTYTVRVDPGQVAARNFDQPDPHTVEIETGGSIETGRDFELRR